MKKVISIIIVFASMLCFASNSYAQNVIKCQAYQLSYKTYEYGRWSHWSAWQDTNILIVFHFDTDRINIYSNSPQEFDIYDSASKYDVDGDEYYLLKCIDQDGVNCEIRLYINSSGASQIYCDYSNIMYVYNYYKK